MAEPVVHALVVATRFGLLCGLALWTGLALAMVAFLPIVYRKLERAQAHDLAAALFQRADRIALGAMGLLAVSLGARVVLDRAAPAGGLLLALALMAASRLIAVFAVGPAYRAIRARLGDANAPASQDERAAFDRLHGTLVVFLTLETCIGAYALFAVS